jgi:hypothetical protein
LRLAQLQVGSPQNHFNFTSHFCASCSGGWHEAIDEGPEWAWRKIEHCAKGDIRWMPELKDITPFLDREQTLKHGGR